MAKKLRVDVVKRELELLAAGAQGGSVTLEYDEVQGEARMTRDPRTDPRAGDCLQLPDGRKRTVTKRDGWTVYYSINKVKTNVTSSATGLDLWQSWSRDAEIVRQA